ncbi:hypothetical protein CDD82_4065 [Ophiocordyceps australis]|uniref:Uncharacterized protein n=1 Tax=Ophiocordyceps australis TaxID=1399860 RepID=A0A2C5Z8D0_9HYPO|nr:hypothetical protein CDD82_4065 [Ophiocordyceps australis]
MARLNRPRRSRPMTQIVNYLQLCHASTSSCFLAASQGSECCNHGPLSTQHHLAAGGSIPPFQCERRCHPDSAAVLLPLHAIEAQAGYYWPQTS